VSIGCASVRSAKFVRGERLPWPGVFPFFRYRLNHAAFALVSKALERRRRVTSGRGRETVNLRRLRRMSLANSRPAAQAALATAR